MDKTIRVSILGRTYPLRVEEADEQFTRRVAAVVDARAREMQRLAEGHPDLTHVVLAAMSLGEEALAAQDKADALEQLAADADALADRLDAAMGGPAGDGADVAPVTPGAPKVEAESASAATAADISNREAPTVVVPTTDSDSGKDQPSSSASQPARQQGSKKASEAASNKPKTP